MIESTYQLFFMALSNKTRFAIIKLLRKSPRNVSEICNELGFEQSRVSHNLKCLESCGFVNTEWRGKNKVYCLDKEYIIPILNGIDAQIKHYNKRLITCGVIK